MPVITRSMAVAADIAVLVFTLLETGHLFKTSLAVQLKTGYTAVLVRNGSLQFIALLILNVISMILDVFAVAADSGPTSEFIYINQAISSILLSRFILDLRFVHLGKSDESSGNVGSSIHFVSAVAGNMGAALDGSWVSGRSSDHAAEETETIQYSENPLSVGLFDKDEDLMEAASRLDAEHTVVKENDDQALTATMIATGHIELQNMA
ncbi:unnamed protein product [Somion occarium]|uniref:Uncharacterized protein n=1 Tax=Somion occarium TaxID=3059160 RepID=A0ABP1CQJ2_9APHY